MKNLFYVFSHFERQMFNSNFNVSKKDDNENRLIGILNYVNVAQYQLETA